MGEVLALSSPGMQETDKAGEVGEGDVHANSCNGRTLGAPGIAGGLRLVVTLVGSIDNKNSMAHNAAQDALPPWGRDQVSDSTMF